MSARLALFLAATFSWVSVAQAELCNAYKEKIVQIRGSSGEERARLVAQLLDVGRFSRCFAERSSNHYKQSFRQERFRNFQRDVENILNDKQAGSSVAAGGSTHLVTRGRTAKVLSFAVEHGALTQSVAENIVTLRGNLAGVPSALARRNLLLPYCDSERAPSPDDFCVSRETLRQLRKASFHVSFDASRNGDALTGTTAIMQPVPGMTQEVVFEASGRQVSGFGFRYEVVNQRDVTSTAYLNAWSEAFPESGQVQEAATQLLDAWDAFANRVILPLSDPADPEQAARVAYRDWRSKATRRFQAGNLNLEARFETLLIELIEALGSVDPELPQLAAGLSRAYRGYAFSEDEIIDIISRKPVLAIEYTNQRPLGQESLSNLRVIFDHSLSKGWTLTFNAAATWYDSRPEVATGSLRDLQVGGQADYSLGMLPSFGSASLSFAGYYQWMRNPAVLTVDPTMPLPGIDLNLPAGATEVFAAKGNIGILQAKLILAPGSSGVRIPFALTYANRTELVPETQWSANFGISFDLDSLFLTN